MKFLHVAAAFLAFSIPAAAPVFGQLIAKASLTENFTSAPAPDSPLNVKPEAAPSTRGVAPNGTPAPLPAWQTKLDRWVDINDLSFSFRYRKEVANNEADYFNNGQQKSLVDGRFKFDSGGKYAVNFHVSSGRTFNWAYADDVAADYHKLATAGSFSPLQLQALYAAVVADPQGFMQGEAVYSRSWGMSFRQLYFSAAPIKQVAFEYGSLYIEKGVSTEATTYDDDGYIAGERIRVFDPKHLYFDQVAFTNAYEGDIITPSFLQRGERLKESNYRQALAAKQFGKRFQASTDYTFDKGTHTAREAVLSKLPEVKVLDSVRLELYQRLNDHVLQGETLGAAQGFAVTGTKTFHRKFQLDGGYAHIDYGYGVLTGSRALAAAGFSMNGDSFLTGNRAFTRANWKIASGVSLYGYYTHTTGSLPPSDLLQNKQGLNGGMTVDFKKVLFREKNVQ